MFRRFSAAVATNREGHRLRRSDRAVQHQRWDREQRQDRLRDPAWSSQSRDGEWRLRQQAST